MNDTGGGIGTSGQVGPKLKRSISHGGGSFGEPPFLRGQKGEPFMATTYYKSRHTGKNKTIEQTMKDAFNYGQNPLKTRDGELVISYECDPKTAYAEFALSKAKYKAVTGREQKKEKDVLFYHKRQSFAPGEIDHDTALQIGYDTAMRWTKGRHAFFVVSHVDRPHPHVHIYYNSTSLDCTRKFRDFLGSAKAFRRLSDRVCLENGLSVITNPKLHSKGKYKHYGEWQKGRKPPTFQERLKAQIDTCLAEKPESFEAFLQAMAASGYEIKRRRGGGISFRAQGQERFTCLRASTLGKGYGQEDIIAVIEGGGSLPGRASHSGDRAEAPRKVDLVIDIQAKMRTGKGPAYAKWATVYNLKQMAAALQYIRENGLMDYADLEKKAEESTARFHRISDEIKATEAAQSRNAELTAAVVDYAKTRTVFEEYKAKKYSNQYLAGHEADIKTYREAQATFKRVLKGAKLPKMDALKAEGRTLAAKKKTAYAEYRAARKDMRDVIAAKHNIDHLLHITDTQKSKEMER
jgi:hypothetical protein